MSRPRPDVVLAHGQPAERPSKEKQCRKSHQIIQVSMQVASRGERAAQGPRQT